MKFHGLTSAEFDLTPGRGRGWYSCWKLQGAVGSTASLGHIRSWGHWEKQNIREKMQESRDMLVDSMA